MTDLAFLDLIAPPPAASGLPSRLAAVRAGDEEAWVDLYSDLAAPLHRLLVDCGSLEPALQLVGVFDQVVSTTTATCQSELWNELEAAARQTVGQLAAA